MSVILFAVVKAALILAVALLVGRLARRSRAAVRHVVLAAAFFGLLVLPMAMLTLPDVPVPVPIGRPELTATAVLLPAGQEGATTTSGATGGTGVATTSEPRTAGAETMFGVVWSVGAFLALLPLAAGAWELRRIRRHARPWPDGQSLLAEVSRERPVWRRVEVLIHDGLPGPMTCGVIRPAIAFPSDVTEWEPADVRRAMRHELEHVSRADCLVDAIARLTCAIYWFLPLAWTAWRQLRLEAERACDDAALNGSEPIAYAEQLVSLATRVASAHTPLMAMAGGRDLPRRVAAVLDRAQRRGRAGGVWTSGGLVAGVAFAGLIAPLCAAWQKPEAPAMFDVASVRENVSGDPVSGGNEMMMRIDPGGRLTVRNAPLESLVLLAYRAEITRNQLGPLEGWMQHRRFDIDARAAEGAIKTIDRDAALRMDRMLQALLADRFKLRVRRESKSGDVYVLSVAPGGAKLKISSNADACAGGADPQRLAPHADGMYPCHLFSRFGRRGMDAVAIDTWDLAMVLREILKAPVEDRARLPMLFDASVHWNVDPLNGPNRDASFRPEPQPTEDDPDVPTALREQLGLRLERQRGSVESLIVEHAEPPASN